MQALQALLDGLLLVANRLAQKVKRLKLALSDFEEIKNARQPMTDEDRARIERKVRHHTIAVQAAIDDVEDEIELAKQKLWANAKVETNRPSHYAEMAIGGSDE